MGGSPAIINPQPGLMAAHSQNDDLNHSNGSGKGENLVMDYVLIPDVENLISDIPEDSIVSRTVHEAGGSKIILFGFAHGQALSEHTAARPAILHFLSGTARVTLGKDSHVANAGAWIYMPANLPHRIYAETPVTLLLQLLPK